MFRFADHLGPGGTRLREVLPGRVASVVRTTPGEFGRLAPLDLRIPAVLPPHQYLLR